MGREHTRPLVFQMKKEDRVSFILDHYSAPHNKRPIPNADLVGFAGNPGCGDEVTIYARLDGDRIAELTFTGEGCTVSMASASFLTDKLVGRSIDELRSLDLAEVREAFGEDIVRSRQKCASLPINSLVKAIHDKFGNGER